MSVISTKFSDRPSNFLPTANTGEESSDRRLIRGPSIAEIDFTELSDGSVAEMIEDPVDAEKTQFAVYRDKSVRYTETVEDQGRILMPPSRANEVLRHIRFSSGAKPYGPNLTREIVNFLRKCLDFEVQWHVLMTAVVMSSWFPELLKAAPYLAFVGPPGSGKTTAMLVLSLLSYRSLLTADISSAAFYDISHRFRPTLFIDETLTAGRHRELVHLLKASSTPGFVSLRNNKARLAYGPKVFSWLELPDDAALNSRCLIVPTHRTSRTDLKNPNDPIVLEHAKELRMQLQWLRFDHHKSLPTPKIPSTFSLSGRPLDLYRAIALPFHQDEKMCNWLAGLVVQQDQFQTRALSPVQAAVMRVLFNLIHANPDFSGFVELKALTLDTNSDLESCGESTGLNERKLGRILTSLSFTNRVRKNTGFILRLDRADRLRIHENIRNYGIPIEPFQGCEMCGQPVSQTPVTAGYDAPDDEESAVVGVEK